MSSEMNGFQRFFHGFEISKAKLDLFRIVFFGIFGLDAFLQIAHAPRYGAGNFNVAHFDWLGTILPLPSRHLMLTVFVLQAFLSFRAMAGVAIRQSVALLTILFGYGYFVSQVNSYQHHYLLFLFLALLNFFPWKEGEEQSDPQARLPGWAVRGALCQLSILYFWTAVAKMDTHWLAGETLAMQVPGSGTRDMVAGVANSLGVESLTLWAVASIGVMVMELGLALGLQVRRMWPFILPIGVLFHGSVEFSGYKIGLFSYFMVLAYILVIPEKWMTFPARLFASTPEKSDSKKSKGKKKRGPVPKVIGVAGGMTELFIGAFVLLLVVGLISASEALDPVQMVVVLMAAIVLLMMALQYYPGPWLAKISEQWFSGVKGNATWGVVAGAIVIGTALFWTLPFDEVPAIAAIVALVALIPEALLKEGRPRRALGHLLACLLVVGLHYSTDQARDYYRFMGGDARRRGELTVAKHAYQKVTEVSPTYAFGHRRLGDLHMRSKDYELAITSYRRAVDLDSEEPLFTQKLMQAYDVSGNAALATDAAEQLMKMKIKTEARQQAQRVVNKYRSQLDGKRLP